MKNTNKEQTERKKRYHAFMKVLEDNGRYWEQEVIDWWEKELADSNKALLSRIREEVIGENEDDKGYDIANDVNELSYEDACDIEERNELRSTQREKLLQIEKET